MRGVETRIQEIRHRIFKEVASMAYHTEWQVDKKMEELPYSIIPGEKGNFRNDVFLERAIVGERLRLAMGLENRGAAEHAPISDGIEAADKAETYYTPPLINVYGGMSEGRSIFGPYNRKIHYRSGQMHQMWKMRKCMFL